MGNEDAKMKAQRGAVWIKESCMARAPKIATGKKKARML